MKKNVKFSRSITFQIIETHGNRVSRTLESEFLASMDNKLQDPKIFFKQFEDGAVFHRLMRLFIYPILTFDHNDGQSP